MGGVYYSQSKAFYSELIHPTVAELYPGNIEILA